MSKPNFFILGAPKCGTTAMSSYLQSHPSVFLCPGKETYFFNVDHARHDRLSLEAFEEVFKPTTDRHIAVGEATAWYLYSEAAVPNILSYTEPRFIVMLRNPVDMAYALHMEMIKAHAETEWEFSKAWALQQKRSQGISVPKNCEEPKYLLYGPACSLGSQMERLINLTEPKSVLPILLEDLKQQPRREYLRVLTFLNVPDDGRYHFPVINQASKYRFPILRKLIREIYYLKIRSRIPISLGLLNYLDNINRTIAPRPPMPLELRAELVCYFSEEITKLESILNRELSRWRCT